MPDARISDSELGLLWLELTNRCQLRCVHCYAQSGPDGRRGEMTSADWRSVIDQAADAGFRRVTFIGGEPTLNHDLPALVEHSLGDGLQVSIFSNFTHVPPEIWHIADRPGVRLETSFYSASSVEHDAITGVRGSHARTLAAIRQAVGRGVAIRVACIEVRSGQRVADTRRALRDLGVPLSGGYPMRPVGRGTSLAMGSATRELCGRCASRTLAVDCDGVAYPCVFARESIVGNVRQAPLTQILNGQRMHDARALARASQADEVARPSGHLRYDRCAP
jgi:MoaA/NifB/PqqE/SkfB family radical SAM enzyme